jgi:hypothetical protein
MAESWKQGVTASCACGQVELVATGKPIITATCYCEDCREAARTFEALPGAHSVREQDGSTTYVLYRNDRIRCTQGREHLKSFKLKETSYTRRQLASCCNTPMYMDFDSGPHWIDLCRARIVGDAPPVEIRTCTKYAPAGSVFNDGIPSPPMHTGTFYRKLLVAWVPMLLNPKPKGP